MDGEGHIVKTYHPAEHVYDACGKLLDDWALTDLSDVEKRKEFFQAAMDTYNVLKSTELLSSTPPKVLTRIINDFKALETIMLTAGFDENFWKGIELA